MSRFLEQWCRDHFPGPTAIPSHSASLNYVRWSWEWRGSRIWHQAHTVLHCSLKLWSLRLLQLYLARSMLHWYFVWLGWQIGVWGALKYWPMFKNWLKNCSSGYDEARVTTRSGMMSKALIIWLMPPVQVRSYIPSVFVPLHRNLVLVIYLQLGNLC